MLGNSKQTNNKYNTHAYTFIHTETQIPNTYSSWCTQIYLYTHAHRWTKQPDENGFIFRLFHINFVLCFPSKVSPLLKFRYALFSPYINRGIHSICIHVYLWGLSVCLCVCVFACKCVFVAVLACFASSLCRASSLSIYTQTAIVWNWSRKVQESRSHIFIFIYIFS